MTGRSVGQRRSDERAPTNLSVDRSASLRRAEVPVQISVDGLSYLVGLELNAVEHHRRSEHLLGAVASTGLLHALWELPFGIAISWDSLTSRDRSTLDQEGEGWLKREGDTVVRTYQPAGVIRSVLISHDSLSMAVKRAAAHPPTVRRVAFWTKASDDWSANQDASLVKARMLGIGVWASVGDRISKLVEPAAPMLGRPVVFRWWQAELAYRNWLSSTEPTDIAVALG